jgi:hypothetical protein
MKILILFLYAVFSSKNSVGNEEAKQTCNELLNSITNEALSSIYETDFSNDANATSARTDPLVERLKKVETDEELEELCKEMKMEVIKDDCIAKLNNSICIHEDFYTSTDRNSLANTESFKFTRSDSMNDIIDLKDVAIMNEDSTEIFPEEQGDSNSEVFQIDDKWTDEDNEEFQCALKRSIFENLKEKQNLPSGGPKQKLPWKTYAKVVGFGGFLLIGFCEIYNSCVAQKQIGEADALVPLIKPIGYAAAATCSIGSKFVYNRFFKPAKCPNHDPAARYFNSHQEILDMVKEVGKDKKNCVSFSGNAHLKK